MDATGSNPADTWRNNNVIITSKRRRDVWVAVWGAVCRLDAASEIVCWHYDDVIMNAIASQITSLTIVYSIVYSAADQRKHQSSASLAFVRGIHRGPVNSPHKWPVTRKMFPFDDVIMGCIVACCIPVTYDWRTLFKSFLVIEHNIFLCQQTPVIWL